MEESIQIIPEYSINKNKYLKLFSALLKSSKSLDKKLSINFDESLISKKITELENSNLLYSHQDWIHKKIQTQSTILSKNKVVVVKDNSGKLDKVKHRKDIESIKLQILEVKKAYISLKNKGVSSEKLQGLKIKIDELEKHLN